MLARSAIANWLTAIPQTCWQRKSNRTKPGDAARHAEYVQLGIEAAITMDLRATTKAGSEEAQIEDEVLGAVNQAAKHLMKKLLC